MFGYCNIGRRSGTDISRLQSGCKFIRCQKDIVARCMLRGFIHKGQEDLQLLLLSLNLHAHEGLAKLEQVSLSVKLTSYRQDHVEGST